MAHSQSFAHSQAPLDMFAIGPVPRAQNAGFQNRIESKSPQVSPRLGAGCRRGPQRNEFSAISRSSEWNRTNRIGTPGAGLSIALGGTRSSSKKK